MEGGGAEGFIQESQLGCYPYLGANVSQLLGIRQVAAGGAQALVLEGVSYAVFGAQEAREISCGQLHLTGDVEM